jgi:hypothetical protein
MAAKTQQFYYDLLSQGYMFRLRVIIRPSAEPIQGYIITSALWDPVVLTLRAYWCTYMLIIHMWCNLV